MLGGEFYFHPHRGWADIISGVEEAGLAWISANYLSNVFQTRHDEADLKPSKGIIEMGGGSSQISFEVQDEDKLAQIDKERLFMFRDFHGFNHNIYAASYLGFGRDHALRRFDKTLHNLGIETNPCHTKGYTAETGAPQMTGTGEYASCFTLIKDVLFNSSMPDQPIFIPGSDPSAPKNLEGQFLGTEVFYYVRVNSKGESWQDYDLTPSMSKQLGNQLCEALRDSKESSNVDQRCFTIAFQAAFLEKVGATGDSLPVVTKDINEVQVEWALGAAVKYLASTVTERNEGLGHDTKDSVVGTSILFMMAVSTFALMTIILVGRIALNSQSLRIWATRSLRRRRMVHKSNKVDRSKYTKVSSEDSFGDHTRLNIETTEIKAANVNVEMQISSRVTRGQTKLDSNFSNISEVNDSAQRWGLPAI